MLVGTVASFELLSCSHKERREHIARMVDKGIDHVFMADHVSFHNGLGMDGLINAATIAAQDERLKVLVGVYLLALRHPLPVARQLATIAQTAPGQLILGVGVGGEDRNEIAMCGVDPATRGRRTDECLTVLEGVAGGEPFDFDGEFFQFERALIKPAPDPAIPILIGGRVDASLERAARFGDGFGIGGGVWLDGFFGLGADDGIKERGDTKRVKQWNSEMVRLIGADGQLVARRTQPDQYSLRPIIKVRFGRKLL